MTPIAEILPFGVSGEIFWEPEPMADAMSALAELPLADLAALKTAYDFYEPAIGEKLYLLGRAHIAANEAGDKEAADQAKLAIAAVVKNTDRMFWSGKIAGILKNDGKGDKQVGREHYFQRTSRALGSLALQALLGNHEALIGLIEISETETQVSGAAKIILQKFSRLKTLVHPQDRLELAQKSAALLAEEYNQVMTDIHEGQTRLNKELGKKLLAMQDAYNYLLITIEEAEKRKKADWNENSEASAIMHNGVERVLVGFRHMGHYLTKGGSLEAPRFRPLAYVVLNDLTSVVHSAFLQNQLLAMAKGVKLKMDVPQGILIDQYDDRRKLESALVEFVNNALKYADDSKTEREIWVRWDVGKQRLVVQDNGIGIKDTEAIWRNGFREAPSKAQGTGKGLAIVKKDLEGLGWQISVASVFGEGTTFFLNPLQIKLGWAKEVFSEIYVVAEQFKHDLAALAENDIEGLERLRVALDQELRRLDKLFPHDFDQRVEDFFNVLTSSTRHLSGALNVRAEGVVAPLRSGKKSWPEAMQHIVHAYGMQRNQYHLGERGYQIDGGRRELGNYLVLLLRYSKPQESWEEGLWTLRYRKGSAIDPQDPVLKTLFEILGWEMTAAEEGDRLVVRVNFGANTI